MIKRSERKTITRITRKTKKFFLQKTSNERCKVNKATSRLERGVNFFCLILFCVYRIRKSEASKSKLAKLISRLQPHMQAGLIMIRLKVVSGLVARLGTRVYVPIREDSAATKARKDPPEVTHKRISRKERKSLRKARNSAEETNGTSLASDIKDDPLQLYRKIINNKNAEELEENVKKKNGRTLLGFVLSGEYDLTVGSVIATAVCSLKRLVELISQSENGALVLVANEESEFFYPAEFNLCLATGI